MEQVNLSTSHDPNWAIFLPAISSFYIAGLGKQIKGEQYFSAARIPKGIPDLETLNFLNSKKGLYTYKWGLYSAGHANLDINDPDSRESIIREREAGTFMLGDSGGFQIMKGQWPADWKDPACHKALAKRKEVLTWMDTYMDYGMVLDVPSQTIRNQHLYDKHGIKTIEDAVAATHINNEYFLQNRTGKCKFLNVLQGLTHSQSDDWYAEMKDYCDPTKYPENHFNGWAFGGQNKIDIHLFLKRLVNIIHDGLLQQGKHDWIHCLGTSILEYAVIFSDTQKAIRKYHNPDVSISFDCATPFFAVSKGLVYNTTLIEHDKKWTYTEEKTAEDKKYSTDTRKFCDAVLADGIHKVFVDSPVSDRLVMNDVCYRGPGFIGQHNKETKTSWDTLSYTLIQSHNVFKHMWSVQEANRRYSQGIVPRMLIDNSFDNVIFSDVIDEIFSIKDRQKSLDLIDRYSRYWMQVKSGQGYSGKKAVNALTMFNNLFD